MKLRARWVGPPPRVGDYLMSEVRPRYAYRIDCVGAASPVVGWDAAARAEVRRLRLDVDRVPRFAVPGHARVHPWKWDARGPRSSSRRAA